MKISQIIIMILQFPLIIDGTHGTNLTVKADTIENHCVYLQFTSSSGDSMKAKELVLLAKYAQGLIVFNSFFKYVAYLKGDDRQRFLLQTTKLICHLEPSNSDIETALRHSDLSQNSKLYLLLKNGLQCEKLETFIKGESIDIEGTFKLLLGLFSEMYQRAYQSNRENGAKFWYWDYSDPQVSFRVFELDLEQNIDIAKF